MSESTQKNDYRAILQQALVSLEQMEAKLKAAEQATHEPLAIIGMGMRFPGDANDSQSFWKLLLNGTDAIGEVPPDRWDVEKMFDPDPDAVGKMYTRWGGFLKGVDQFDPHFFGISPREAVSLDPQQRLLLETSWEALESAGQASAKLSGSRTGVFVGMVSVDYANMKLISGTANDMDAYFGTGISRSIAAGRISYIFGLQGPAVTVDTACSSSLVAVHQACQSLRMKECDMAIAGGVNMILEPTGTISTSRARMMSFDGRCKTFDAKADGYVRSEGGAMIVLKRLSDALADGDSIQAVILGTAINQDGRSNGMTAPNGKAQEAVIRAALADARIKPAEVDFVETHGTGTSLGDPIEVRALGEVFGDGHSAENPLMIGSVKTNVGHLEAAAGIVGLVKVVLALQNKTIPPHIHLHNPNPYIPWEQLPVSVPVAPAPWPAPAGKRRVAGLSSFGFSGTNSHMILAEAPAPAPKAAKVERSLQLMALSAKTEAALRQMAEQVESYFAQNLTVSLPDAAYTLNKGRAHYDQRLVITAADAQQAQERLALWRREGAAAGVYSGSGDDEGHPLVVFMFTGQGAQYAGMGRQLFDTQPTFRKSMEQCDAILRPYLDRSILPVIYPDNPADEALIHQTIYTQPALFALEYSLAKLWQSWGVEPDVVLGHSIGEYVAACIAGIFSLEDGLKFIAARGRLMQQLPAGGVMAVVFANEDTVRAALAPHTGAVSIAAVNGPGAVVISGQGAAVEQVTSALAGTGVKSQPLTVSHAFHSPLIEPMLAAFEAVAQSIQYQPPQIGIVSNVSGKLITDDSLSKASYWRAQTRSTVRFEDSIRTLKQAGYRFFLEVGPNPTLLGMARRCEPTQPNAVWLPSLSSKRGDWEQMLDSLANLYIRGQAVNWENYERDYQAQRVMLPMPTYPFQRQRYWMDFGTPSTTANTAGSPAGTQTGHPLLGLRLPTATPVFQKQMNAASPAYLADHRIHDLTILPATAYIEIAFAAAKNAMPGQPLVVEDFSIHEVLPLSAETNRVTQVSLTQDETGASFQYFSRDGDALDENQPWRLHASGRIQPKALEAGPQAAGLDDLRARLTEPMPVEPYYAHLAAVGAGYGPAFRGIQAIWRADGEALADIALPPQAEDGDYSIHPALLDACLQLLGAAVRGAGDLDNPENRIIYVPVGMQRVTHYAPVEREIACHVALKSGGQAGARTLNGDVVLYNRGGQVAARVEGILLQQVDYQALRRAMQVNVDPWLYEVDWLEQARGASSFTKQGPGTWLVFADASGLSHDLCARLAQQGETCHIVTAGDGFAQLEKTRWQVNPAAEGDFSRLLAEIQTQAAQPLRGIVHLWSLMDALDDTAGLDALHQMQQRSSGSVLHIAKALASQAEAMPRLYLVTRGALTAGLRQVNPAASALWGLGNVIALELPSLNCVRIDLDQPEQQAGPLFAEIWTPDGEDQLALRGERRLAARLARAHAKSSLPSAEQAKTLVITERGVLDNLALQPVVRRQPGPDEVEIEVHATGLNFRDVLNALGMYPGDAGPLGSECAGIVSAVGSNVQDLKVGDAVIALATSSFSSYVTIQAQLAVPKPAGLSFVEAATIPIAFLTADYALNTLAKMKAGHRVLIHAAAGGVGMAAVQLAQRAGAEIFGTAGSPEKRALLQSLGVQHIFHSRTLDFADEILALTGGEGVDIVLNSLAGEFIPKSLSLLKKTGSFVEIGKTDVWDAQRVSQLNPGIAYFILYLGEILDRDPGLIRQMLVDLLADFENGRLKPLPQRVFPLEASTEAFRFMAQARHSGKIVITQQRGARGPAVVREDASYLITGGLGGLGLTSAGWLVEQGARHLILMGRSQPSPQAQEAIEKLRASGAVVTVAQADAGSREDLEKVLADAAQNMPPLRGIIHAAGLLDDGILLEQSWPRFLTVMRPKSDGAWNLHALTLDKPLDFFILYSAGASLMGSAGQGNYAAANAFLDGLAHYRRANGLPALSINWGAWAEVGMAAKLSREAIQRWSEQGVELIRPADGMRAMRRLLELNPAQAAVLPMNWQKLNARGEAARPLLRLLVKPEAQESALEREKTGVSFLEQLEKTEPENKRTFVAQFVTAEVNKVLGLDASHAPNPRHGFTDIGLDSLMAVELSNRLQKAMGQKLPSTLTFEYPTILALTQYLAVEVLGIDDSQATPASSEARENQSAVQAAVDEIADDDLEDALLKELKDAGY